MTFSFRRVRSVPSAAPRKHRPRRRRAAEVPTDTGVMEGRWVTAFSSSRREGPIGGIMSEGETQSGDVETAVCHVRDQRLDTQEELSKHLVHTHPDAVFSESAQD